MLLRWCPLTTGCHQAPPTVRVRSFMMDSVIYFLGSRNIFLRKLVFRGQLGEPFTKPVQRVGFSERLHDAFFLPRDKNFFSHPLLGALFLFLFFMSVPTKNFSSTVRQWRAVQVL